MSGQARDLTTIPEEIRARLGRATIRLSEAVGHPVVASVLDQLLPAREIDGEIGRRLAEEVRLLRRLFQREGQSREWSEAPHSTGSCCET
jgi:hypothetical protein